MKQPHSKPTRKLHRFTPKQLKILHTHFTTGDHWPGRRVREFLATMLCSDQRRVQVWFQNQRAKLKIKLPRSKNGRPQMAHSPVLTMGANITQDGQSSIVYVLTNSEWETTSTLPLKRSCKRTNLGTHSRKKRRYSTPQILPKLEKPPRRRMKYEAPFNVCNPTSRRLASNPRTSNLPASNRRSSPNTCLLYSPRTSNPRTSNSRTSNRRTSNPRTSNPRTSNLRTSNLRTNSKFGPRTPSKFNPRTPSKFNPISPTIASRPSLASEVPLPSAFFRPPPRHVSTQHDPHNTHRNGLDMLSYVCDSTCDNSKSRSLDCAMNHEDTEMNGIMEEPRDNSHCFPESDSSDDTSCAELDAMFCTSENDSDSEDERGRYYS